MNLYHFLEEREAQGKPVRIGIIGAGKFSTMYMAQAKKTPGVQLVGIVDLLPEKAKDSLRRTMWEEERIGATSLEAAEQTGAVCILTEAETLIGSPCVDIIIEATGSPEAGVRHVLWCCEYQKHIIMVNVETDAVAGPLLAKKAEEAGIIYSLAYGDQPAMIAEMVDWARAVGFEVVAAGKGTKYLPRYHQSTPETIWNDYGISPEKAKAGGMNPKMFNSFLDGTKSAIEMAAVSNATGLLVPEDGLKFPPCGTDDLHHILKPKSDGGMLPQSGMVEVVSSLERDGRSVYRDLRMGIFVVVKGDSQYITDCFEEYYIPMDHTGTYISLARPYHMIGLELGVTVASIATRGEATGYPKAFLADVVATAKRDLAVGEELDGEGGFTVYGKVTTAAHSLAIGGVPLGLCNHVTLKNPIAAGAPVRWTDIVYDETSLAIQIRKEMEATFAPK